MLFVFPEAWFLNMVYWVIQQESRTRRQKVAVGVIFLFGYEVNEKNGASEELRQVDIQA